MGGIVCGSEMAAHGLVLFVTRPSNGARERCGVMWRRRSLLEGWK